MFLRLRIHAACIAYISFRLNGIFNLRFFIVSCSLLRKNKKIKNSPVSTMSRNCKKLHLRFCWKAVLPRNKLKLCFRKKNCPCEVTLEPCIQQLVDWASFKVLVKFKLKPWEIFSVENSKIKHAHWQIKKQINTQVKLHFESDTL